MTATDIRRTRNAFAVTPLLPLAVVAIMLGVGLLIATVAPSQVTSGIYQVVVEDQFTIPTESLTCTRDGSTATCTTPPIAGQPIVATIAYFPDRSTCTAHHGEQTLSCRSTIGDYGHASHSVWISTQLGVTEPELTRLRDALPWWRNGDAQSQAGMLLIGLLAVAAAVASYFLGGRARSWARRRQWPIAIGTALLGLAVFAIGGLTIAPADRVDQFWVYLISPMTIAAAVGLGGWQRQLCGDERIRRARYAIGAGIATTLYVAITLWIFLLQSGFID